MGAQAGQWPLPAPYPYFGGKARVAAEVWKRFGDVDHYIEPFFGSGAVLLGRPPAHFAGGAHSRLETINDKDAFITNFWRSVQKAPDAVAYYADTLMSENELHARHAWLVSNRESLTEQVEGNPEFYDAKIAGWWVWGMSVWIGDGFCSGRGPWSIIGGRLVRRADGDEDIDDESASVDTGVWRKRPHMGRPEGVSRKGLQIGGGRRGVQRTRPHMSNSGLGINRQSLNIPDIDELGAAVVTRAMVIYLGWLSDRFRHVRVASGEWSRIVNADSVVHMGNPEYVGVFLDPPYVLSERTVQYSVDSETVAGEVYRWAMEHGEDRRLRIAVCYYEGQFEFPSDWSIHQWEAPGGYGNQGKLTSRARTNSRRERVAFSPACLNDTEGPAQLSLWSDV